ncbi:hypothetical protein FGG08_004652 [Glutinoglossum americanum]|uniref:Uncharacterized protein n=1 Tax=Glutinoglossum americanum TaxID=1670608 RepID=A0A9P8I8R9_9PEZI|nr:hypothetical protein FGG08_004652 [Glutinoglossum americanum]
MFPQMEAKIANEVVVFAHWIQRHEHAIKTAQGAYAANHNNTITFDTPSTTVEFYLRRVPGHDPKLYLMGDLYLICQAKIGSMIQELTDKIRADSNHDSEKAVHYSGRDGRSRDRKVTIGCLLDVLKGKAENLIDFGPFVIGAMNKYYERERALRVLEGLEDMAHPRADIKPHQNAESRIVSYCSKLSPFHIFAHLNEKHRGESLKEEQRLQILATKEAMEKPVGDGDHEAPRRAAFAVFEAVRDRANSNELAVCRDVSYFSDKNISSRYDRTPPDLVYKPSDSGYVSGTTKEQLEEYNKLSSEEETVPSNTAPRASFPQTGQMINSPTVQLQTLTEDVWTGYGCGGRVGGVGDQSDMEKSFDWGALIERYPASASRDKTPGETFNWERALYRTEQHEVFPRFTEDTLGNDGDDMSLLGREISLCDDGDNFRTANRYHNQDEDNVCDEETLLRKRAHTMALLEGKDENANAIAAAWDQGKVGIEFLAELYAPKEKEKTKKGFFARFLNVNR